MQPVICIRRGARCFQEEGEYVSYHPGEGKQANPLVEEGLLFHTESEENSEADKHVVHVCVEHSKAAGHPCVRYVDIFGEVIGGLKRGWSAIKHLGSSAVHKAVKFVNWLRRARCDASQRIGCNSIGNVSNGCELAGVTLFAGSFLPESELLTAVSRGGGAADLAEC